MSLQDGQLLYHGSYIGVEKVDFSMGSDNKDFGKGFYLTTDERQAQRFVGPSIRKAIRQNKVPADRDYGFVSVFRYHAEAAITSYAFDTTDKLWLQFIAMNRLGGHARFENLEQLKAILDNDLIMGKVANDQTNETITAYLSGAYGAMDDDRAIEFAISQLRPDRLTDQLCFRSEASVHTLEPIEVYRYDV
ncbi:MAG: DUF3990 domain-containing protein [Oscillospiraceae bacterium]|nr:DUF3990 domain-containing protein [Oscillospiraceae bacterium]